LPLGVIINLGDGIVDGFPIDTAVHEFAPQRRAGERLAAMARLHPHPGVCLIVDQSHLLEPVEYRGCDRRIGTAAS